MNQDNFTAGRTVKDGIIRIENPDNDHWYKSEKTGNWYPSVTTITGVYPKGEGLNRWLGQHDSYESAIEERDAAGRRGSRVHDVAEKILKGEKVTFDWYMGEHKLDIMTAASEWRMIEGLENWLNDTKPKVVDGLIERRVINEDVGYGGTVDLVAEIDGTVYVIDFKTSGSLYYSHEMQVEAYRRALAAEGRKMDDVELALLHLKSKAACGYTFKDLRVTPRRTKQRSKDQLWEDFLASKTLWHSFDGRTEPKVLEVRESVSYTPES